MSKHVLDILLIEDDPADVLVMRQYLSKTGRAWYTLRHAQSLKAARSAFGEELPDVVFLDLMLTDSEGLATLSEILQLGTSMPIIVLTGVENEMTAMRAIRRGAQDYIVKGDSSCEHIRRFVRYAIERKEAQEALRQSEERFRQLVESTRDVFWVCDAESKDVIYVSPAYEQVWGRHCTELYEEPQGWIEAIHPGDRRWLMRHFFQEIRNHSVSAEYRIMRPDGSIRWIRNRGFPIQNNSGHVYRIGGVAEDVTLNKQAEEDHLFRMDLERQRDLLKNAVGALERVLGVVGHELRTPLAGIRAMTEFLLKEDAPGGSQVDFLGDIHREIIRMTGLINDLLEVTRLNSGTTLWRWSDLSVADACHEALESVQPLVDQSKVRLVAEIDPPDLKMPGDAGAIRRLVLNLVSNAQKYTSKGCIQVCAKAVEQDGSPCVELRVEDSGEGMPQEVADRLGSPFALHSGVVGESHLRGCGLGLTICRGIVSAHGGSITVYTAPGQGTTVTVLMRADLEQAEPLEDVTDISCEVAK